MSMKYLAAYALASLNNPSPSAADVQVICKACNIEVDADSLAFVMDSIQGRSVATLIAEGAAKMSAVASVSTGGAAAGGAAAHGASAASAAPAAAAAAKEEEEEDDDMGFGLFD